MEMNMLLQRDAVSSAVLNGMTLIISVSYDPKVELGNFSAKVNLVDNKYIVVSIFDTYTGYQSSSFPEYSGNKNLRVDLSPYLNATIEGKIPIFVRTREGDKPYHLQVPYLATSNKGMTLMWRCPTSLVNGSQKKVGKAPTYPKHRVGQASPPTKGGMQFTWRAANVEDNVLISDPDPNDMERLLQLICIGECEHGEPFDRVGGKQPNKVRYVNKHPIGHKKVGNMHNNPRVGYTELGRLIEDILHPLKDNIQSGMQFEWTPPHRDRSNIGQSTEDIFSNPKRSFQFTFNT